jgi:ATP-dependent Clp protease ATP-binding subunit ClpA
MFERFDKELKQVLIGAPRDAAMAGSTTIEAEHLLIGLVSSADTKAGALLNAHGMTRSGLLSALNDVDGGFDDLDADALATIGIDLSAIQRSADEVFGPGALGRAGLRPSRGGARFGESAKSALSGSLHESVASRSRRITPVHLLLALARDPQEPCARLLATAGLDYETIRREAAEAA